MANGPVKEANQGEIPERLNGHPVSGWVSFLLFQGVVVVFCAMVVVTIGGLMPGVFPNNEAGMGRALLWAMYLSMPVAVAGAIAGIMAVLQETRRRVLGVIGVVLNGGYVLVCLGALGYR